MKILSQIVLVALVILAIKSNACTVAVISGKATPDGRPLLWKQRDTSAENNKLVFETGKKYNFVGITNAEDAQSEMIWMGVNSVGFAIMNSASYNLQDEDAQSSVADLEGVVMRKALEKCATVDDFKQMLRKMKKPLGVEANFGVIDAQGGAAFFETNNYKFTMIDANDATYAPEGYIIRSNYSFTGRPNEGYGFIRFQTATDLFYTAAGANNITPEFILSDVARSQYNALTKENLYDNLATNEHVKQFRSTNDCIARNSTTNSFVIKGVNTKDSIDSIELHTILGNPLSAPIYPIMMPQSANDIPKSLTSARGQKAPLCSKSLALKKKYYPINRGSGRSYINFAIVANKAGTGTAQRMVELDKQINIFWKLRKRGIITRTTYQQRVEKVVNGSFKEWFND